jgi:hypothetical protein
MESLPCDIVCIIDEYAKEDVEIEAHRGRVRFRNMENKIRSVSDALRYGHIVQRFVTWSEYIEEVKANNTTFLMTDFH